MKKNNILNILFFFCVFLIFSKEFLILNEEFLLICSFSCFFSVAYRVLGNILRVFLQTRADDIAFSFISIYEKKKSNIEQFQKILKKYPELLLIISTVFAFGDTINLHLNKTWDIVVHKHINFIIESRLALFLKEELSVFRNYYLTSIFFMFENIIQLSKTTLSESEEELVKDVLAEI